MMATRSNGNEVAGDSDMKGSAAVFHRRDEKPHTIATTMSIIGRMYGNAIISGDDEIPPVTLSNNRHMCPSLGSRRKTMTTATHTSNA